MAITMQGSWTLRVRSRNAAFAQRFVVSGAASGNGTYTGSVGTSVFVSGAQWSVNIQHQPTGQPWRDSAQRIGIPSVAAGLVRVDIRSNDSGGDADYDDLVLEASLPASDSEYIVYGTAKTYAGACLFNPCRDDYVVIDPHLHLPTLCERFPRLCQVIEKIYPERLRIPRIPPGDPAPELTPLVLPTGLPNIGSGLTFQSRGVAPVLTRSPERPNGDKALAADAGAAALDQRQAEAVAALQTQVRRASFKSDTLGAGKELLVRDDFKAIAALRDIGVRLNCDVQRAAGLLLRFQEYDRTASELLGGAYTGSGARQDLGLAVTDELGNYLFRYSRSLDDVAQEFGDVAAGESLATALRPDLIAQVLGTGLTPTYETAPYSNVANLRRIDLCIPYQRAHPSRACAPGRVIQRIGDVLVLESALASINTLDGDGRITARNANAPAVDCAGWRGHLRLYACFGRTEALHYAIFHKRPGELLWRSVDQPHKLDFIPHLIDGGTSVGATNRPVTPGVPLLAGPGTPVPTYENHEGDLNWIENDLKMVLDSTLYRPADEPGPVQFHIEAYDSAGHVVAGTVDDITLYIHNRTAIAGRPGKGDIAGISMGGTPVDDCAFFQLTSPNAPLTLTYRAVDPEGFLADWSLSVLRGNNHPVAVYASAGAQPKAYTAAAAPCDFTGTRDEPLHTVDDYVDTELRPGTLASPAASWLPPGVQFCAFSFTLTAHDRVTDGRSGYPLSVSRQDLVGLSMLALA